jgi:hypothetical protein
MSTINRSTKANGTINWADTNFLPASELNVDFDTIYNDYNGSITNANLSAAAAIDPTKIDDYSGDVVTANTVADAGDSAVPVLANNMAAELIHLRYALKRLAGAVTIQYKNAANAMADAGPNEPPIRGFNLIHSGCFSIFNNTGTPPAAAPVDWNFIGARQWAAGTTGTAPVAEGSAKTLRVVTATGAEEGAYQTLPALKASTKYLIGARVKAVTGTLVFRTLGGLGAGNNYQDFSISTTSASFVSLAGIVKTDASATGISVYFGSTGVGNTFEVFDVFAYELSDDIRAVPNVSVQYNSLAAAATYGTGVWNWETVTQLSHQAIVPAEGFMTEFRVQASLNTVSVGGLSLAHAFGRIKENGVVVAGPFPLTATPGNFFIPACFSYINYNPAANTGYTYTFELLDSASSGGWVVSPVTTTLSGSYGSEIQTTSESWMIVRRT